LRGNLLVVLAALRYIYDFGVIAWFLISGAGNTMLKGFVNCNAKDEQEKVRLVLNTAGIEGNSS